VLTKFKIRKHEIGLHFHDREFQGILAPGSYWKFNPLMKHRVDVASTRDPFLNHQFLDTIVESGAVDQLVTVVDLKDTQRGLVWIDGRFNRILPPGLHVYFKQPREVRVEIADASDPRLEHPELKTIINTVSSGVIQVAQVDRDHHGVLFVDSRFVDTLNPGRYAFWTGLSRVNVFPVDMREAAIDVCGQEIMTADKVSLRMNAIVNYRVVDPRKALAACDDASQSLYREVQLALRAIVGSRDLDGFLADKDEVANELHETVKERSGELGLEVTSAGIRDVILPGDMKDLMNKVTEAKKAAEANLISRREETAAMRSQANTAKLLADNPTLMRLRELEVLEQIAASSNLNVVLGEKGLTDRMVNLL
jgi:regulator of protease activity HflC (stomatin/prohibitin superfamily)